MDSTQTAPASGRTKTSCSWDGWPGTRPLPPAARGSRLQDVGARTLVYFLVQHPRTPLRPQPLAARQTAVAGRPQERAAVTHRPPISNQTRGGPW
jgi:hypothetical protein